MNVLLVGRNSWIGSHYANYFNTELSPVDVLDDRQLSKAFDSVEPDVVINCVGYTGRPNIDACLVNKVATGKANTVAPSVLYEKCRRHGAKLVHISSGCLWHYGQDLTEEDLPVPPSFYSATKFIGDELLKTDGDYADDVLILRIRMPFDGTLHPRNLISKLVDYPKVVSEEHNSLTYIPDLLLATEQLIELGAHGIYNIVNPGRLTNEWILKTYQRIVDPDHKFTLVSMEHLLDNGLCVEERSNCTLSTEKFAKVTGHHLGNVEEAMEIAMLKIKHLQSN